MSYLLSDFKTDYPFVYRDLNASFQTLIPPISPDSWLESRIADAVVQLPFDLLGEQFDYATGLYVAHEASRTAYNASNEGGNKILSSRKVDGEYSVSYAVLNAQSMKDFYQSEYGDRLDRLLRSLTVPFMVSEP